MLKTCPECGNTVSDKAVFCPHCGNPSKTNKNTKPKSKRMRLPNGFGQISEIRGGRLRNPFRAMITIGINEDGKPICRPLKPKAYFATYNEAYAALVEQHKNPYSYKETTLEELYTEWLPSYEQNVGKTAKKVAKMAWACLDPLRFLPVQTIRPVVIRDFLQKAEGGPYVIARAKMLLNMLMDYAVEMDIIDRNYSRAVKLPKCVEAQKKKEYKSHLSFSDKEMSILWGHLEIPFVDMLLIQCYSGWRPGELIELKMENIDLNEGFMVGGNKTEAGIDRKVPIHPVIRPLLEAKFIEAKALGSEYLFPYSKDPKRHVDYEHYKYGLKQAIKELDLNSNHRPHDGRKQFVTMCKQYGVDEYAIKYMVGHSIKDLTESIYTDRSLAWLQSEIEKIRGPEYYTIPTTQNGKV